MGRSAHDVLLAQLLAHHPHLITHLRLHGGQWECELRRCLSRDLERYYVTGGVVAVLQEISGRRKMRLNSASHLIICHVQNVAHAGVAGGEQDLIAVDVEHRGA